MSQKSIRMVRSLSEFSTACYDRQVTSIEITAQTKVTGNKLSTIDAWASLLDAEDTILIPVHIKYTGKVDEATAIYHKIRPGVYAHYEKLKGDKIGKRLNDEQLKADLKRYTEVAAKRLAEVWDGFYDLSIIAYTHFFPDDKKNVFETSPLDTLLLPPADDISAILNLYPNPCL